MNAGMRDFSLTFGSKMATLVIATATQSTLAWCLAPAGRGSYAVCSLFCTILLIVCVFGSDVAAQYFLASKRMSLSDVVMNTFVYGGLGCGLGVIVGLILIQTNMSFLEKAPIAAFWLALVMIPSSFFSTTFIGLLGALSEFTWLAGVMVTSSLANLVFIVLFVPILKWDVNGALGAMVLANAFTITVILALFRFKYGLRLVLPSRKSIKEMFYYGIRYYVGKISNKINFQVGTLILAFFASKEEIGMFALAAQLTGQAMLIPDALSTVLIPRVASDQTGRRELVAQCSRIVIVVCGMGLLTLAIFATPIVKILFSPAFLPMVWIVRIAAIGVLVRCACKMFVPFLVNTNHPGTASVSVAFGMIVNFLGLWWLMPQYGLNGAAWAMTLGYLAGSTILIVGFSRISGLSVRETWRFRRSDWAPFMELYRRLRGRSVPAR